MSLMPICWYESPTWTRKRFFLFLEMKSDRSRSSSDEWFLTADLRSNFWSAASS